LAAIAHQKDMVSQEPSTRGAVKAGEAAREAGCLDGEHGDGSAVAEAALSLSHQGGTMNEQDRVKLINELDDDGLAI
jgi:hypothetical protein